MHSFNVKYSGEGLTLINTAFFDCGGRQQLSVQTNYQRRKKRIAGRRILDKSSKEFFLCVISTGLLYCKAYAAVRHHTGTSGAE